MSFGTKGSSRREQEVLDKEHVKYRETLIRVGDIDFEASKRLNARTFTRLNDDLVQEYALAMENGAEFPMHVVVHGLNLPPTFPKVDGWLVVSGLHRASGALMRYGPDFQYRVFELIEPTAEQLWYVATATNTVEGMRLSKAEQINSVITAIDHGISIEHAIKRYGTGVSVEEVQREREDRKINMELLNFGIDPKQIERRGDRPIVLTIPDVRLMKDVVVLIKQGMTQNDLRLLVGEIRRSFAKTKTSAESYSLIAAARDTLVANQAAGKKKVSRFGQSYYGRLVRASGLITHLNVSAVLADMDNDEKVQTVRSHIRDAKATLDDLDREITARHGA